MTHPHPKGNFVPKAVLMKSGIKTLNTAGQNFSKATISVNTARPINTAYLRPTVNCARPASNVFNREHTHVRRPFNMSTTNKNSNLKEKVNIVKGNVTNAGPKAVGNPQLELQEKGVIDSGCSRHMTGNKSYLSDYKEKLMVDLLHLEEIPKEVESLVKVKSVQIYLGKFDGKGDEGFFVGYSTNSKTYKGITTNGNAGTNENIDAGQHGKKIVPDQEYILLPLLTTDPSLFKSTKDSPNAGFNPSGRRKRWNLNI
ncbi:hypothetical protein Tco_1506649 [Tanacetum coccineum]